MEPLRSTPTALGTPEATPDPERESSRHDSRSMSPSASIPPIEQTAEPAIQAVTEPTLETSTFTVPESTPEPVAASVPEPTGIGAEIRYWFRPLALGAIVLALLGLTFWDSRRVPDRPVAPTVNTATPQAGATVSASDPALTDMLARLRQALSRRDAKALASLADPEGVLVAAYNGALPDTGYNVTDTQRLAQEALGGSQLSLLGWRNDGRGRVIVLSDGWQIKPLRLAPNSTLELTSLSGIGLAPKNGVWYWRWLLPDPNQTLTQQARNSVWQDMSQISSNAASR
jgi:hypothetical protein